MKLKIKTTKEFVRLEHWYPDFKFCMTSFKSYVMGSANGNVIPPYSSVHSLEFRVLLVSTEVTYFVCGLLFVLVVEEWVWDYGISVTILHVAITSTGVWWATVHGVSRVKYNLATKPLPPSGSKIKGFLFLLVSFGV
ncbi:hypothetical protein FD754_004416 [Muntiacus muntjak]|uniref:Transmembrane protein 244 n=1 Tax=Muntiacus muntjak TaxID=9888 RepID=A0A5N3WES7_MUNMU|nr:hypothetical protein FD754_004416 [Muntiacus muntjak]